jgi:hypothetical protein
MFVSFHLLKTYIRNPSVLYFFHPPTYTETPIATTIRVRIYARGEVSFAKFIFLPSWFVTLLEANFYCFTKIKWMPSGFVKLLELLNDIFLLHLVWVGIFG